MFRLRLCGLVALALVHASGSTTPPPPRAWALETRIEFLGMSEFTRHRVNLLLLGAVDLANSFPPYENHLFSFPAPRDPAKALRLIFMDSRRPGDLPGLPPIAPHTRSAVFLTSNSRGASTLNLIYFVDRLVLDAHAYANLTLELVKHVFGLVHRYQHRTDAVDDPAWATVTPDYGRAEMRAFLHRLLSSLAFKMMDPEIREGFVRAYGGIKPAHAVGCGPDLWNLNHSVAHSTKQ